MRVLQVHNVYRQPGGEDVAAATEAQLLRDAGHTVHTHHAVNPASSATAGRNLAVAIWNRAAAHDVRDAAGRFQPDVVHVHNIWFSLSAAILPAVRDLGIPVVMTLHNYRLVCAAATLLRDGRPCRDCVGTHPWHAVRHRCYRDSRPQSMVAAANIAVHQTRQTWHRDVDRFLALTEFGRHQFIDGGLPADLIEVKSNSVSDPGARAHPPSEAKTVIFIGRLAPEKGVATLLEAWRSIPPPFELMIVGEGPLAPALHADAPERVTFRDRLAPGDVRSLMLDSRALVFPSLGYEGQGLVALEAAAAGLPVLLSDHGAMSEMFMPDAESLMTPPGDVAALSRSLSHLLDDTFVDASGSFVRRRFEERYTHEIATRRLETIYRDVMEEGTDHGSTDDATSR